MSNKLVSIIIPYFNGHATILETLDSIKKQAYPNYEILLINNGSTASESKKLLEELTDKNLHIYHQENSGPSSARNQAIKLAKGDYIIPLDSDDIILPNAIQESVEYLNKHSEYGVVYGMIQMLPNNTIRMQEEADAAKMLVYNQLIVSAVIRKEVFTELGGYDEKLDKMGLEDWEFWLRVLQTQWKFKRFEKVHFAIREHAESRTYQSANKQLAEIKKYIFEKHALWISEQYERLYYQDKMLQESIHVKIGNVIFQPYRFIKRVLKG